MTEVKVYAQAALYSIPVVVYWVLVTALVLGVVAILFSQKARIRQRLSLLLICECVAFVFCSAVVFRETKVESSINMLPLWSYFIYDTNSYLKEMTAINYLNICMFFPIGFLLKLGFRTIAWKQTLLVGIFLSISIELFQFILRKGFCEIDDLIHNGVGCLIGYGVATLTLTLTKKW